MCGSGPARAGSETNGNLPVHRPFRFTELDARSVGEHQRLAPRTAKRASNSARRLRLSLSIVPSASFSSQPPRNRGVNFPHRRNVHDRSAVHAHELLRISCRPISSMISRGSGRRSPRSHVPDQFAAAWPPLAARLLPDEPFGRPLCDSARQTRVERPQGVQSR